MRRLSLYLVLSAALVGGCSRQEPKPQPIAQQPNNSQPAQPGQQPQLPLPVEDPTNPPGQLPAFPVEILQVGGEDRQLKYDAALAEALVLSADQNWAQALIAFETAQSFQDSEFVKAEILKLRARLDQEAAAQKTLANLQTILDEGKAAEANKLTQEALQAFGASDVGQQLVKLRLQAEALQAAQNQEDPADRFRRLREEGEAALREQNLRAAALAFEQALAVQPEPNLRQQLEDLRTRLTRYDEFRLQALQLRKDPIRLEETIALLEEARKAWDTLQVRQEIDETRFALQHCRDRVSVADFEVRGDTGMADAGRTLAEELLPHLKRRYDVMERAQLARVLDELRLENHLNLDPAGQREAGKLARVRYLVLGTISRVGALQVSARLVDVQTGLVVQTAKITGSNPQELLARVEELGQQLLMNDEEKQAYDQRQIQLAKRPAMVDVNAPLAPFPQNQPAIQAPLPLPLTPVPPELGNLTPQQFGQWQTAPPPGTPVQIPVAPGANEDLFKQRLLHTVVELGDDLFRGGRPQDARRHFTLALSLAPGRFDIRFRLDQLPPPPPPLLVVQPVVLARPRVAILNFPTFGNPGMVPPYLGTWTPQHLAPYLVSRYEIADPQEVFWYMNRLGMTLRDLMEDHHARRWLGRALNVRYFLLGNLVQTASFDVHTYLIDAEFGFLQGQGRIHVRHPFELKLRLAELAEMTLMDPRGRAAFLAEQQRFQVLVADGQRYLGGKRYAEAVVAFESALRIRGGNTEVQFYLHRARTLAEQAAREEARRRELARQEALAKEAARKQWELARLAEAARFSPAPLLPVATAPQKQQAQLSLIVQARNAFKGGNFTLAITTFESALGLGHRDDLVRDLAEARAEQARQAKLLAQQQEALRLKDQKKQRDLELAQTKAQLEAEKQKAQAAMEEARKAQQARDDLAYQVAFDEGQKFLAKGNFEAALSALQTARRVKKTEVVEQLINHALTEQAKAAAAKKGEAERLALEKKLLAERQKRLEAEKLAKERQDQYQALLAQANQALKQQELEIAKGKFQQAGQLFQTDAVLTGLEHIRQAQQKIAREEEAKTKKKVEEQQRVERLQKLLADGNSALKAQQFETAVKVFHQARQLAPDQVEVLTGLVQAEAGRDRQLAEIRKKSEQGEREENFKKFLKAGQDNLASKQYDAAVVALTEAVKWNPQDPGAKLALQEAQKAQAAALAKAQAKAEFAKKIEAYQKQLEAGKIALTGKRYEEAIQAFAAAQKLLPGDKASLDFLQLAQQQKTDGGEALKLLAKKKAEEEQKSQALQKSLQDSQLALARKDLAGAQKALDLALQLSPQDPRVLRTKGEVENLRQALDTAARTEDAFQKAMSAGQKALQAKQFDQAMQAFSAATKLKPGDPGATQLFQQAQKSFEDARVQTAQEAKAQQEFQDLVNKGQKAFQGKKYEEAVKAFQQAVKLRPQDVQSAQLLLQAQKAFDNARNEAGLALKNQQAYDQTLAQGQRLLIEKKYAEAVQAFQQAAKILPSDPLAGKYLQQAQKAWDDAKTGAAQDLKNQQAYQQLLAQGQKALQGKNYPEAIQAFQQAVKIFPNDPQGGQLLLQTQKAWDDAKNDTAAQAAKAKLQQAYQKALQTGQQHLGQKRFGEAIQSFNEALKILPGDPQAAKLLQQANQEMNLSQKNQQNQQEFNRLLQQGNLALLGKRYAEAQKLFADALKLMPTDPRAQIGYQNATRALETPKTKTPEIKQPEPKKAGPTGYQKAMDDARAFEKQNNFTEAIKSYQEALRQSPNDAKAAQGLKLAQYSHHLLEGQKLLNAGKNQEAIRQFEAALQISPGNPAVLNLLNRAKQGKK